MVLDSPIMGISPFRACLWACVVYDSDVSDHIYSNGEEDSLDTTGAEEDSAKSGISINWIS
jgi:hypothetical protein